MRKPNGVGLAELLTVVLLVSWFLRHSPIPGFSNARQRAEEQAAQGKILPWTAASQWLLCSAQTMCRLQENAATRSANIRLLEDLLGSGERLLPRQARAQNEDRVGWEKSSLYRVVWKYSDKGFQRRLRLSRPLFHALVRNLTRSGWVTSNDSKYTPEDKKMPAEAKVAIALFHLAYGGISLGLVFGPLGTPPLLLGWQC